jgi:hypothetical protein
MKYKLANQQGSVNSLLLNRRDLFGKATANDMMICMILTDEDFKDSILLELLYLGSGYELLKTVSTRISLHFPQIQEMYSLFRNLSIIRVHDPQKIY